MNLALSICVLLISFMQWVNGAQFLNVIYLSLLFRFAAGGGTGVTVTVPLTSRYALL